MHNVMPMPAKPIEVTTQRDFQSARYILPADETEKGRSVILLFPFLQGLILQKTGFSASPVGESF